jgi:hypothetical protein
MARIPEAEIQRLRTEVSVVRLVEEAGIALTKTGKDHVGRCPFHADDTASLVITGAKNLWHCFGCDAGGGPIDWVMRRQGVSFRHAVELLREGLPLAADRQPASGLSASRMDRSAFARNPSAETPKQSRMRPLPPPVKLDADDQALLVQTIDYYHATLKASPEALAYLEARGLRHPELTLRFRLGYANRTLGLRLPSKQVKAGAEIRTRLERIGIYRESGHEHLNGSLVVPVIGPDGMVHEVYGRKIRDDLRVGTAKHLYLPGAHAGVWNEAGLAASGGEVILCEALIDAMTFWVHGLRNVTASYGVNGFTPDHLAAFERHGIRRVLIAYDRDDAGNRAAAELAEQLMAAGIECFRVLLPKGMDVNEYAQKVQPAGKALALAVRKAEWLGKGKPPVRPEIAVADQASAEPMASSSAAAPPDDAVPEPAINSPVPPAPAEEAPIAQTDTELVLLYGDRRYRVRGHNKPLNPEALKVNLLVSRGERFHVDSLDLYQAKARAAYVKQAGIELGEAEDVLRQDLGRVLLKLETMQAERLEAALAKNDKGPGMDPLERADALALLEDPHLMDRILADFDAMGVVGEETNKLVGYLAAVSRQLDKPLAVLVQSSSAAGKSALMDAVLALMPQEAQLRYSAMTGQSVFYMRDGSLKNRILAIAEEAGAEQASYALKLLQSDGSVTMASTGKDPETGLLVTHEYRVEGPVMLFLTTTAIDIDEELMNRCLVLTVNEGREQTRAIHAEQRRRQTLEGLLADEDRQAVQALHRNAQRLLQPFKVVNPFADRMTFADDKTRMRRDHTKYLTLIRAIALLHQYQRPVKTVQHRGKLVHYIEVVPSDIALANRLAGEVLGRSLDELPPQTRLLLTTLHDWIEAEIRRLSITRAEFRFTRRQVRELTGWGDTQLRVHLGRLAELEYLLEHGGRRGQAFQYELAYGGEGEDGQPFLMGLIDADTLESKPMTASSRGPDAGFAGGSRPQSGPIAAALRGPGLPVQPSMAAACSEMDGIGPETARQGEPHSLPSYRNGATAFPLAANPAAE